MMGKVAYRQGTIWSGPHQCPFEQSNAYRPSRKFSKLLPNKHDLWAHLAWTKLGQQNIGRHRLWLLASESLLLLVDRYPLEHARVDVRVVVQFARIRFSPLRFWPSVASDPEVHDDRVIVQVLCRARCYIAGSAMFCTFRTMRMDLRGKTSLRGSTRRGMRPNRCDRTSSCMIDVLFHT